jgi:hypothetical protein
MSTAVDTLQQVENWSRFEAGARAAIELVRGFGADQPTVTAMLVRLLVADLRDSDARPN